MEFWIYPLLILAGFCAGFINTLAGAGSVITLAVLNLAGLLFPVDAFRTAGCGPAFPVVWGGGAKHSPLPDSSPNIGKVSRHAMARGDEP